MIANYTDLVATVGDWLDRADLAGKVPNFVQLVEARLNRKLDDPEMEVSSTSHAVDGVAVLPDDYGSMVSITVGDSLLTQVGNVEFSAFRTVAGTPRFYAIVGKTLRFAPAGGPLVTLVYRRKIPALSYNAPTNWLLTRAPDLYLYGTLMQAEGFLAEDDRLGLWKGAFDEALNELIIDGQRRKWGAGTLRPRIYRP